MQFAIAFEKAFGRPPTRVELDKVRRVQDAFGVGDNDALMTIAALLVFCDSGFLTHLQQSARLLQAALRDDQRRAPCDRESQGPWRAGALIACMWAASMAFVGGLGLAVGAGMARGYPCWVPQSSTDRIGVTVLGAPTGWLVLLGAFVPGLFAGAWALSLGMNERQPASRRWLGWAACAGVSVALLSLLALVLLKVPRS